MVEEGHIQVEGDSPEVEAVDEVVMAFEDENGVDDDKALATALRIIQNFEWKPNEVNFYFNQLEIKMTTAGVKKNWTKFQVLTTALPTVVQDEVKSILQKGETDFPNNDAYKVLKTKILKIFGQSEESRFDRAMQRTLTGKPSQLARALVNDICDHEMTTCCCKRAVGWMWKRSLPMAVRQQISHLKFDAANFDAIVELADKVYGESRPSGVTVAAVQSIPGPTPSWTATTPLQATPDLNQAFIAADPNDPVQVAAQSIVAAVRGFGRGRGRGYGGRGGRGQNRGGRGGGQSSGGQSQNSGQSGNKNNRWSNLKKHADNPPSSVCKKHYVHGKSAHWCEEPATCPWKDFFIPKGQQ